MGLAFEECGLDGVVFIEECEDLLMVAAEVCGLGADEWWGGFCLEDGIVEVVFGEEGLGGVLLIFGEGVELAVVDLEADFGFGFGEGVVEDLSDEW